MTRDVFLKILSQQSKPEHWWQDAHGFLPHVPTFRICHLEHKRKIWKSERLWHARITKKMWGQGVERTSGRHPWKSWHHPNQCFGLFWERQTERGWEREACFSAQVPTCLSCSDKLPNANTYISLQSPPKRKIIHYQWASFIRRWSVIADVQILRNIINITDGFLVALLSFQLQMRTAAEELFMTVACLIWFCH